MKLDPRIKEGCKPFTMFDTDAAKEFIGKKGFFHDNLEVFYDMDDNAWQIEFGTLKKVSDIINAPFFITQRYGLKYFLPLEYTEGINVLEIGFDVVLEIGFDVKD